MYIHPGGRAPKILTLTSVIAFHATCSIQHLEHKWSLEITFHSDHCECKLSRGEWSSDCWLLIPHIAIYLFIPHSLFTRVSRKRKYFALCKRIASAGSVHLKKSPGTYFIVISKFKCISNNKLSQIKINIYTLIFIFVQPKVWFCSVHVRSKSLQLSTSSKERSNVSVGSMYLSKSNTEEDVTLRFHCPGGPRPLVEIAN